MRTPAVATSQTGRGVLLKGLSEATFQAQVIRWAERAGWRAYHTHRSDRSQPGFPDTVLVRGPRLIFAELKRESGRLSDAQGAWLSDLMGVPGVEAYVWRPSDEAEIKRVLAA